MHHCQLARSTLLPLPLLQTMKRAAQHDAGSDDDTDNHKHRCRRIPRVIRNAMDGAPGLPLPGGGYIPAVSVQIPRANCWAPYDAVVSALRSLSSRNPLEQAARVAARATLEGLFEHPAPFAADVRFPEAAVYLPLDHGKFGQCMCRIKTELTRIEAIMGNQAFTYSDKSRVTACVKFMDSVSHATGIASLAWGEDADRPVQYDRGVFEMEFGLIWNDA